MSSSVQRWPAKAGFDLALILMGWLADVVDRIQIAGSLRRDKPDLGDLELVMMPKFQSQKGLFGDTGESINLLNQRCDEMLRMGLVTKRLNKNGHPIAWGDREKAMVFQGMPVDFFIVLPDRQWGPTMLIRTGPGNANGVLVTRNGVQNRDGNLGIMPAGMVMDNATLWREGKNLNTPEEVDVFREMGLPYIPPHLRSVELYHFWAGIRAQHDYAYAGKYFKQYGYVEAKWSMPLTWGQKCLEFSGANQEPPYNEINVAPGLKLRVEDFVGTRVAVLGSSGVGKALALDTPLPTTSGWTTMGEVQVGDSLLDENGNPTRVISATEIQNHRKCFIVRFSDNSSIITDAEHLWLSHTWQSRRADSNRKRKGTRGLHQDRPQNVRKYYPTLVTTEEMGVTLYYGRSKRRNHAIPCSLALNLPDVKLPIEPYTFGIWLGDGSSQAANVTTADNEILEQIRSDGYFVADAYKGTKKGKAGRYRIGKGQSGVPLNTILRANGLLMNKHVPEIYLRASYDQRLALLQGLMDSDGTIASYANTCIFSSINKQLSDAVAELVVSLGWIANRYDRPAKLYDTTHGTSYIVCFRPLRQVFRLSRKAQRFNPNASQVERYRYRYVVSVEPVQSVPVRCIQVESPSHLYLAGLAMIPTHNSNTIAVLAEGLAGKLPLTIVDLESEYHSLRDEYPFVVAGRGAHVDREVGISGAAQLAREALNDDMSLILDLLEFNPMERNEFLRTYFEAMWEVALKARRPHTIILEEAHEFIPQNRGSDALEIATRIALRGRKRGLGMILASQRAAMVSKNVLTQANMLILHLVQFPNDIRTYQSILPLMPSESDAMIKSLGIGQAIIRRAGMDGRQRADVFQMRRRRTEDLGATPILEQLSEALEPA